MGKVGKCGEPFALKNIYFSIFFLKEKIKILFWRNLVTLLTFYKK
jgi:hypothetical protein